MVAKRTSIATLAVFCLVGSSVALGCAHDKNAAKGAKSPLNSAFRSHWEKGGPFDANGNPNGLAGAGRAGANDDGSLPPLGQDASVDTTTLHVSDAIVRACNLPRTKVNPSFDFDSTSIGDDDKTVLEALAKCLGDGALKGRGVTLVGRCDPRGENEYNMTLGAARADSVRRYLNDMGVQPERVSASSRGELDATGSDETGWAMDRRVDIDLAGAGSDSGSGGAAGGSGATGEHD